MPYVKGFLKVVAAGRPDQGLPPGEGPVDPGWGVGIERPDQGLPPSGPVDPGYGVPLPPVVSHPIPPSPEHPIVLPPTYPVDPDYGLPTDPEVWPQPPSEIGVWPPSAGPPLLPTHPIYPGGGPDHELPLPPGSVWPPLPPSIQGPIMCLIWIVGVGYRWTTIDPGLKPSHPIAGTPEHPIAPGGGGETPSHPIAPTPQPRRA